MYEAGKTHLGEEVKQITAKGKADIRQLNSEAACVLERGEVLAELNCKQDEKDAEQGQRRQRKCTTASPQWPVTSPATDS